MPPRHKLWITVAVLSACLFIGFAVAAQIRQAHRLAEMSDQLLLLKTTGILVEEHFQQHGSYPQSLDSLALPPDFDRSMIADMQYESDGNSYSLVVRSAYDGEEYTFKDGQVQPKEP